MRYFEEASVPIEDIAAVLKQKPAVVEAEALALGMTVGRDWADRPAVVPVDARGLVTGEGRRQAERQSQWMKHQRSTAEWESARTQVVAAAQRVAYDGAVRSGKGAAEAHSIGLAAGREAGAAYERTTPRPSFDGTETTNLMYIEEGKGTPVKALLSRFKKEEVA